MHVMTVGFPESLDVYVDALAKCSFSLVLLAMYGLLREKRLREYSSGFPQILLYVFILTLVCFSANFLGATITLSLRIETLALLLKAASVGFFEELLFRGIAFNWLFYVLKNAKYGLIWAIIVSSLLFGFAHVFNQHGSVEEKFIQIGYGIATGVMFASLLFCTRTLLLPIILHTTNNLLAYTLLQPPNISLRIVALIISSLAALIVIIIILRQLNTQQMIPLHREKVES